VDPSSESPYPTRGVPSPYLNAPDSGGEATPSYGRQHGSGSFSGFGQGGIGAQTGFSGSRIDSPSFFSGGTGFQRQQHTYSAPEVRNPNPRGVFGERNGGFGQVDNIWQDSRRNPEVGFQPGTGLQHQSQPSNYGQNPGAPLGNYTASPSDPRAQAIFRAASAWQSDPLSTTNYNNSFSQPYATTAAQAAQAQFIPSATQYSSVGNTGYSGGFTPSATQFSNVGGTTIGAGFTPSATQYSNVGNYNYAPSPYSPPPVSASNYAPPPPPSYTPVDAYGIGGMSEADRTAWLMKALLGIG
jgi:hypothetical protein